ncbi:ERF family protein [Virgibacillus sp. C22-A2]|uniref:ERF family protein n=1 Tax=Virgibacillus tibetensis TaxID=3042313 RepID=A0ABU6KB90_9BACI|nr:ERF family protein [Virgibacillus sp. C22-A2]
MNKSESIVEISKALAKFQEEVKQPLKDADNPFFKSKYVPLENVVEAIAESGPKNGLSFVQWPKNDETGRVGVATLLMHTSGEFIEFDAVFMKADKETPQGAGALITYLKRYSLSAIYGITSDADDDANSSSGNQASQSKTNGARASDKQLNFVTKLLKEKATNDIPQDRLYNGLKNRMKTDVDMENWTAQQASEAIKILSTNKSA